MHEAMPKYLKVPASSSNSKMVMEIFKNLKLANFKDQDLDNSVNRDKLISDFISQSSMISNEFQYLDLVSRDSPSMSLTS